MLAKAVKSQQGVKGAIQEFAAHDLIRIEDILPFFPKDTLIDDFRDEICSSLEKCVQSAVLAQFWHLIVSNSCAQHAGLHLYNM